MPARPNAPHSRRERPAKAALTRDGVIATAVAVMRAEGLAKVTMRRLAQELDTGPASLYVYVRNVAELHAAILDEVLGTVEASSEEGPWQQRLEAVLTSYTALLFEFPGLARSALVARPNGPNYLALIDTLLALLDEGDVAPERAAWGVDALLQYATANAAEHATRDESSDAEREWDDLTAAVHSSSAAGMYPHIAAVAGPLLSGTPRQRLSWGLQVVMNGIRHTPIPTRSDH